MRKTAASSLALILVIFAGACRSNQFDTTMLVTAPMPRSFASDIAPILQANCSPCHIGMRTSGVEMTTYSLLTTSVGSQYGIRIVQPGNASASPIIDKISSAQPVHGVRMPQIGDPLSASQIQRIRDWIDDGAIDN